MAKDKHQILQASALAMLAEYGVSDTLRLVAEACREEAVQAKEDRWLQRHLLRSADEISHLAAKIQQRE